MTNPVILLGTQSNGETLPVQVDATGRLVAEGLQGEPGQPGPPGAEGPAGEFPDGAYDGAVLGWQDGEVVWMDPPSGGLPGGGTEGQIIQIVDGEPVWVSNPSVPPNGTYEVTLITPAAGQSDALGLYDSGGVQPNLLVSWDTYQRMSPYWMEFSPGDESGLVGKVQSTMTFKLNIQASDGKILRLKIGGKGYCEQGKGKTWTINTTIDDARITPITPSTSWDTGNCPRWSNGHYEATFLLTRPNIGEVNVTVTMTGSMLGVGHGETVWCTGWDAVDSGQYLIQRMLEMRKEVSTADLVGELLPEVGSTTDIDPLRPS